MYPFFAHLTESLKRVLGSDFPKFVESYTKSPESNLAIKEEYSRNEREALHNGAIEREKFAAHGLVMPPIATPERQEGERFCHSSLSDNIREEFKDAKWVVITSPLLKNKNQGSLRETQSGSLSV